MRCFLRMLHRNHNGIFGEEDEKNGGKMGEFEIFLLILQIKSNTNDNNG